LTVDGIDVNNLERGFVDHLTDLFHTCSSTKGTIRSRKLNHIFDKLNKPMGYLLSSWNQLVAKMY